MQAVARRLIGCLGPHDTVARFGGDEFLMLCPDICSADQARTFGRRIIAALAEPLPVYGRTVALSVSIGIALHPAHSGPGAGAGDLVAEADLAMYSAKRSGRNNVAVFDADLRRQAADRLSLEADLSRALINDELHCHYQPIVDLPSGQLIGLEALLRWRSPPEGPCSHWISSPPPKTADSSARSVRSCYAQPADNWPPGTRLHPGACTCG